LSDAPGANRVAASNVQAGEPGCRSCRTESGRLALYCPSPLAATFTPLSPLTYLEIPR
jgi:hypothetical protein